MKTLKVLSEKFNEFPEGKVHFRLGNSDTSTSIDAIFDKDSIANMASAVFQKLFSHCEFVYFEPYDRSDKGFVLKVRVLPVDDSGRALPRFPEGQVDLATYAQPIPARVNVSILTVEPSDNVESFVMDVLNAAGVDMKLVKEHFEIHGSYSTRLSKPKSLKGIHNETK